MEPASSFECPQFSQHRRFLDLIFDRVAGPRGNEPSFDGEINAGNFTLIGHGLE
jgi:hypothetical protein